MAHVAKYQAGALGNMCRHYGRWGGDLTKAATRDNIDPARTEQNYNLAPEHPRGDVSFINERIEALELKRKPRKDAVRMCDCVLTKPKSLDDSRADEFFKEGYEFLSTRYGAENVVSAWVHMDEATPHMHFAWVPVTHDGRLSAKDVLNRRDLQTLHQDMQAWFDDNTDLNVSVLLDDDQVAEKQLSHLKQDEYIAAKQKLEELKKLDRRTRMEHKRLEYLRQREAKETSEITELDRAIEQAERKSAPETVSESFRTLYKARGDGKREEGLREAISGLRERIRAAESERERLRERFENLTRIISVGIRKLIRVPSSLSEATLAIARSRNRRIVDEVDEFYLPSINPFTGERWREREERLNERSLGSAVTPDADFAQVRAASRILNSGSHSRSHSRGRSF